MITEARQSIERLKEIALKPNPMSEVEYIDILIEAEKCDKTLGFLRRISVLKKVRAKALLLSTMAKANVTEAKGWRDFFQDLAISLLDIIENTPPPIPGPIGVCSTFI